MADTPDRLHATNTENTTHTKVKDGKNHIFFPEVNGFRNPNGDPLPGFYQSAVEPVLFQPFNSDKDGNSGLVVGRPHRDLPPPEAAFNYIPIGDTGHGIAVPKGFYTLTDEESEVDSKIDLPDWGNPLSFITNFLGGRHHVKDKRGQTNGIYLPMPFGIRPVNIQFMQENTDGNGVQAGFGTDTSANLRRTTRKPSFTSAPQQQQAATAPGPNPLSYLTHRLADALDAIDLDPDRTREREQRAERERALQLFCQIYGPRICQQAHQHHRSLTLQQQARRRRRKGGHEEETFAEKLANGNLLRQVASHMIRNVVAQDQVQAHPGQSQVPIAGPATPVGTYGIDNQQGRATGAYIGLPFMRPVYLGTYSNTNTQNGVDVGV